MSDVPAIRTDGRLLDGLHVAVLLPCHNEEQTIAEVVRAFKTALPTARVYVYDNASTDRTVERALGAGAMVRHEPRRGKGNVVCRMFADIDADVYVMADGDGTYDAAAAPGMAHLLVDQNLDMVVGCRTPVPDVSASAYPPGHVAGNWLFNRLLNMLFGASLTDVFSGYRVMSRRFVKSFPVRFTGFEIETELATHTIDIGLPYAEVSTTYLSRHVESKRKLRTFRDGVTDNASSRPAVQGDASTPLLHPDCHHLDGDRAGVGHPRRPGVLGNRVGAKAPDRGPECIDPDHRVHLPHCRSRARLGLSDPP